MILDRKRFSFLDVAFVGAGVAIILLLQFSDRGPAPQISYVVEKEVDIVGPAPRLSDKKATEAYETFLNKRGYYGTFASADDGAFGWADNHTSQANADQAAITSCAEFSETCQIIARLRPVQDMQFKGFTLSYSQAKALDDFPARPNHKAIALTDYGIWGAAWERTAPFVAKQAALTNCKTRQEKQRLTANQPSGACQLVTLD